jgi:hypothetical protein
MCILNTGQSFSKAQKGKSTRVGYVDVRITPPPEMLPVVVFGSSTTKEATPFSEY